MCPSPCLFFRYTKIHRTEHNIFFNSFFKKLMFWELENNTYMPPDIFQSFRFRTGSNRCISDFHNAF